MATPLIRDDLNKLRYHGRSLSHWVDGLTHITVQTLYGIQYLTMRLSGYINAPTDPEFISLRHGKYYLMHHQHEPFMHLRKKIFQINEIALQFFLKSCSAEINQTQGYSKFLHTCCDADRARDISDKISVTPTAHLFNITIADWCSKK